MIFERTLTWKANEYCGSVQLNISFYLNFNTKVTKMITKPIVIISLVLAVLNGALAESCRNPRAEAASFTSEDATIVSQIAYIAEFSLQCDGDLPKDYALYAEVEGRPLTAARVGENKYQVKKNDFNLYLHFRNSQGYYGFIIPLFQDKIKCHLLQT